MNGTLDSQGLWLQVHHSLNTFPAMQLKGAKADVLLKITSLPALLLQQVSFLLPAVLIIHYVNKYFYNLSCSSIIEVGILQNWEHLNEQLLRKLFKCNLSMLSFP